MATTSTTAAPAKVETVTLRQIAETLSESHELPKKQVMSMLEDMVETLTKHLKRGARIRIGGLGVLQVREKYSKIVGLWVGEAGQPNEVCHILSLIHI